MLFDTAWIFYRTNRKIADAAGVSEQAVSLWKKKGIIPIASARAIEESSGGAIKVDSSVYTKK
jgi:hypothetical protein